MNIEKLATSMLRLPIRSWQAIHGGGNNKIYKIICENEQIVALKLYSIHNPLEDFRRLEREYYGLTFLAQEGETSTPRPIAINKNEICALYEWAQGEKPREIDQNHLNQTLAFIKRLKKYSQSYQAAKLPLAQDHSLNIKNTMDQIERRFLRLIRANQQMDLLKFLNDEVKYCKQKLFSIILLSHINTDTSLPFKYATLSPSDFGFHNTLYSSNELIFIDFEYFGWEDPVAMLAHFLWHPGMELTAENKIFFAEKFTDIFSEDLNFKHRFQFLFPLIGLVWTLILLNEFIPDIWKRRVEAGSITEDQLERKCKTQLQKAKNYLKQIELIIIEIFK